MGDTQTSSKSRADMRNMIVNVTKIDERTNSGDQSKFFNGTLVTKKSGKICTFNADAKYVEKFLGETGLGAVPSDVLLDLFGFFNARTKAFVVRRITIAKSLEEITALSSAKKAREAGTDAAAPVAESPAPAASTEDLDDEIPF